MRKPYTNPAVKCKYNRGNYGLVVRYGPCLIDGKTISWVRWFMDEAERQAGIVWFNNKKNFTVKCISRDQGIVA